MAVSAFCPSTLVVAVVATSGIVVVVAMAVTGRAKVHKSVKHYALFSA